jgi:hypothetical protein
LNDEPANKGVDNEVEEQGKTKKEWVLSILWYLIFASILCFGETHLRKEDGFVCVCLV